MDIDLDKAKASELHALAEHHQLDSLSISGNKLLTTDVSQYLKRMTSLRHLSVWTTMTRTALNDCLSISGLEILDIRTLSTPGNVIDTSQAKSLTTLRGNFFTVNDLHYCAQLPKLRELGAQSSDISPQILSTLARKPTLEYLDLEGVELNDRLITILAQSKTLTHLELCSASITRSGLCEIVNMQQLTGLDIWNTRITDADLSLLKQLPNLSYLAIGGYEGQTRLTGNAVMSEIVHLPSLKHLWIHNIYLTEAQRALLTEKCERFQYDFEEEY